MEVNGYATRQMGPLAVLDSHQQQCYAAALGSQASNDEVWQYEL
jgi:hypothetical protein